VLKRILAAHRLSILLTAGIVAAPLEAAAAPVTLEFYSAFSYMDLEFGPALGYARIAGGTYQEPFDDRLSGPNATYAIYGGTVDLASGPLVDVSLRQDGDADYTHAAGGFVSIAFNLLLPSGTLHSGTFFAPLGVFTVQADGPGNAGSTFGQLGAGLFDSRTAMLLGIQRQTLGGNADLYLDTYDFFPDPYRVAKAFGSFTVIADAPEPMVICLMVVGAGVVARRVRRRRFDDRSE
jgi:hypothetical protein